MPDEPHRHRLRLFRRSEPGRTYSVTLCCVNREPLLERAEAKDTAARLIEEALAHGFSRLDGYVVMPDHVHLMFELGTEKELAGAIGDLKKLIARRVNAALGRSGALWEEGYYEHTIRSEEDYVVYLNYILDNPVRRELARAIGEYRWCRVGPWEAGGRVP